MVTDDWQQTVLNWWGAWWWWRWWRGYSSASWCLIRLNFSFTVVRWFAHTKRGERKREFDAIKHKEREKGGKPRKKFLPSFVWMGAQLGAGHTNPIGQTHTHTRTSHTTTLTRTTSPAAFDAVWQTDKMDTSAPKRWDKFVLPPWWMKGWMSVRGGENFLPYHHHQTGYKLDLVWLFILPGRRVTGVRVRFGKKNFTQNGWAARSSRLPTFASIWRSKSAGLFGALKWQQQSKLLVSNKEAYKR